MDDTIIGFHFRDRERELYERQIEFERELDRERFAHSNILSLKKNSVFVFRSFYRNSKFVLNLCFFLSFVLPLEWMHWPRHNLQCRLKQR